MSQSEAGGLWCCGLGWLCQGCCWSAAAGRKLPFLSVELQYQPCLLLLLQCTFSPRSQCWGGAEQGDFTLIIFQAFRELFFTHGHNLTPELCSVLVAGVQAVQLRCPGPSVGWHHCPTQPLTHAPTHCAKVVPTEQAAAELCGRVFSRINYL